jgi:hypothetical protein
VILLAAVLLLVAVGLLAVGLTDGSTTMQWGSFAASALAAVVLAVGEVRRRKAARATGMRPGRKPAGDTAATATGTTTTAPANASAGTRPAEPREPAATVAPSQEPEPAVPPTPAAHASAAPAAAGPHGEPPVEVVEVTDLLVVLDLTDEVLVIDEHPRYHLAGCRHLAGQATFPMPMVEARTDGFTPCGACTPDRHLAQVERSRRAGR